MLLLIFFFRFLIFEVDGSSTLCTGLHALTNVTYGTSLLLTYELDLAYEPIPYGYETVEISNPKLYTVNDSYSISQLSFYSEVTYKEYQCPFHNKNCSFTFIDGNGVLQLATVIKEYEVIITVLYDITYFKGTVFRNNGMMLNPDKPCVAGWEKILSIPEYTMGLKYCCNRWETLQDPIPVDNTCLEYTSDIEFYNNSMTLANLQLVYQQFIGNNMTIRGVNFTTNTQMPLEYIQSINYGYLGNCNGTIQNPQSTCVAQLYDTKGVNDSQFVFFVDINDSSQQKVHWHTVAGAFEYRNGTLLKNGSEPFTPQNPCSSYQQGPIETSYKDMNNEVSSKSTFCCSKWQNPVPSTTWSPNQETTSNQKTTSSQKTTPSSETYSSYNLILIIANNSNFNSRILSTYKANVMVASGVFQIFPNLFTTFQNQSNYELFYYYNEYYIYNCKGSTTSLKNCSIAETDGAVYKLFFSTSFAPNGFHMFDMQASNGKLVQPVFTSSSPCITTVTQSSRGVRAWTEFLVNSTYTSESGVMVQSTISVTANLVSDPVYACVAYKGSSEPNSIQIIVNDGTNQKNTECSSSCTVSTGTGSMIIRFQYTQQGSVFDIWPQGNFEIDLNADEFVINTGSNVESPNSITCGAGSFNGTITVSGNYIFEYSACSVELSSAPQCSQGPNESSTTRTTSAENTEITTIISTETFSTYSSNILTTSPPTTAIPGVNCADPETKVEEIYCDLLNGTQLQPGNISSIMGDTLSSLNITKLTGKELSVAVGIFEICSKVEKMKEEDFHGMAYFLDGLIEAPTSTYENANNDNQGTGSTLLKSISRMMINSPPVVSYLSGNNIALIGRPVDCNSSNPNLYGLSDHGDSFGETPHKDTVASIAIDPTTACRGNTNRVFYSVYRNQKFFVGNATHSSGLLPARNFVSKKPEELAATTSSTSTDYGHQCDIGFLQTNGIVTSATAMTSKGTKFVKVIEFEGNFILHKVLVQGKEQTLTNMKFNKKNYGVSLHGKMKTTWFDDSQSSWSRDTCGVKEKGGFYESSCNRLNDFTMIVDGSALDPVICSIVLTVVNYVFSIGSMLSLIFLNVIYVGLLVPVAKNSFIGQMAVRYLPKNEKDESTTLYDFLQMIFFLNFVVFSRESRTTGKGGCTFVAILNYWILMSCVILSLFQSWKILKTVSWTPKIENFLIKVTSPKYIYIGTFVVPTLLAIGFGAGTELGFFYRNDSFCWIRPDFLAAGVIIPLTILGINAAVCSFIITLRSLPKLGLSKFIRGVSDNTSEGNQDIKGKVIALFSTQFSLGFPWLLQHLTLSQATATVYHFLFHIINGSQGIILLCSFILKGYRMSKSMKNRAEKIKGSKLGSLFGFFSKKNQKNGNNGGLLGFFSKKNPENQNINKNESGSGNESKTRKFIGLFSKKKRNNDHVRPNNLSTIEEAVVEEGNETQSPTQQDPETGSKNTTNEKNRSLIGLIFKKNQDGNEGKIRKLVGLLSKSNGENGNSSKIKSAIGLLSKDDENNGNSSKIKSAIGFLSKDNEENGNSSNGSKIKSAIGLVSKNNGENGNESKIKSAIGLLSKDNEENGNSSKIKSAIELLSKDDEDNGNENKIKSAIGFLSKDNEENGNSSNGSKIKSAIGLLSKNDGESGNESKIKSAIGFLSKDDGENDNNSNGSKIKSAIRFLSKDDGENDNNSNGSKIKSAIGLFSKDKEENDNENKIKSAIGLLSKNDGESGNESKIKSAIGLLSKNDEDNGNESEIKNAIGLFPRDNEENSQWRSNTLSTIQDIVTEEVNSNKNPIQQVPETILNITKNESDDKDLVELFSEDIEKSKNLKSDDLSTIGDITGETDESEDPIQQESEVTPKITKEKI